DLDTDEAEDQADGAKREGDRITEQQENHERREHDRRHVVDQQPHHRRLLQGVRGQWGNLICSSAIGLSARRRATSASAAACAPPPAACGSGIRPIITAMRLISSESPWKNRSVKPINTSIFA